MLWIFYVLISLIILLGLVRRPDLVVKPLHAISSWLNTKGETFAKISLQANWPQVINGLVLLAVLALLSTADVTVIATTIKDQLGQTGEAAQLAQGVGSEGASTTSTGSGIWDQIATFIDRQPKLFIAFAFFGASVLAGYLLALAMGLSPPPKIFHGASQAEDGKADSSTLVLTQSKLSTALPGQDKTPQGVISFRYFLLGVGLYATVLTAQVLAANQYQYIAASQSVRKAFQTEAGAKAELKKIDSSSSLLMVSPFPINEAHTVIARDRVQKNSDSTLVWVVIAMSAGALVCGLLKNQAQEAIRYLLVWVGSLLVVILGFGMQIASRVLDVATSLATIPGEVYRIAEDAYFAGKAIERQNDLREEIKKAYRTTDKDKVVGHHEMMDVLRAYQVLEDPLSTQRDKKVARMRVDIVLASHSTDEILEKRVGRMLNYLTDAELASMNLGELAMYQRGDQSLLDFVPAKLVASTTHAATTIARMDDLGSITLLPPDAVSSVNLADARVTPDPLFYQCLSNHEALVRMLTGLGLVGRQVESLVTFPSPVEVSGGTLGGFQQFFGVQSPAWQPLMQAYQDLGLQLQRLLTLAAKEGVEIIFPTKFVDLGSNLGTALQAVMVAQRSIGQLILEFEAELARRRGAFPVAQIVMEGTWFKDATDANFNQSLDRMKQIWRLRP